MATLTFTEQVNLTRRLRGTSYRYVQAHDRDTDPEHLGYLGLLVTLEIHDAIAAGWNAAEIGHAMGIREQEVAA